MRSRIFADLFCCVVVLTLAGCLGATTPDARLSSSAYSGDLAEVRRLHESGATLEGTWGGGMTPLMGASAMGHAEVVRYLIANGADLDAVRGPTFSGLASNDAVGMAAANGHWDVLEILVLAGANPQIAYRTAYEEKNSLSERLGNAMFADGAAKGYAFTINLIETRSPWFRNGRFVRPDAQALADARTGIGSASGSRASGAERRSAPPARQAPRQDADDEFTKLRKLKALLDEGVITQEEFDAQKARILSDGI